MANALKKIITRAKQIAKAHPSMQWKSAVKKAGAEYRGGKIKKTRKKAAPKVKRSRPRRKPAVPRAAGVKKSLSLSAINAMGRQLLKDKLAGQLLRRDLATTKRAKRKISKTITATRSDLKKFM